MTSSHPAILNRPRAGAVRSAALVGAALGFVALALGIHVAIARADNSGDEPRPENANVQRAAQNPPPARVILPAPWQQAAPAQPVAAPAKPADRK
ncbi:hypothetical protein [Bradyrhizobium sp. USDA 3256]